MQLGLFVLMVCLNSGHFFMHVLRISQMELRWAICTLKYEKAVFGDNFVTTQPS